MTSRDGDHAEPFKHCVGLVTTPPGHPYFNSLYDIFLQDRNYVAGTGAKVADPQPSGYLYRIGSLPALLRYAKVKAPAPSFLAHPNFRVYVDSEPKELHRRWIAECPQWEKLRKFVVGALAGPETMTWWSSHEVQPDRAMIDALELGMCHNVQLPMIYRLDLSYQGLGAARVPTEFNALAYPVFDSEHGTDGSGMTINLSDSPSLRRGHPEYIVQTVSVDAVDVMPVQLDHQTAGARRDLMAEESFWDALLAYRRAGEMV